MTISVGVAGVGAIGSAVCRALIKGIGAYRLAAISDIRQDLDLPVPNLSFEDMTRKCDMVIECLPPAAAPVLAQTVLEGGKDLILISSCALLTNPEILDIHRKSTGRIIVPSGALIGLDGVNALKNIGIKSAKIVSTKPPKGFKNAPYVDEMGINLDDITTRSQIFSGNALEAAKAFPANVNVAATLSLAGIGPEKTKVEVWVDPHSSVNSHEILVESEFSLMQAKVQNAPDPANPKSSVLAAQSIIAVLQGFSDPLVVL